ncbi:MlaC/ttg2D family ABC transporter substrate-binding protein [Reinekea forsetii]|uniref:ABC-type transport system, auxiliary component n=1 Tax=Reinekea forsetii TaxID=1336806 RepID=A0A2K8KTV8_9GAMM|nr:ABC transporter substrate-binding protein [Reinekea forsetii]ATX77509.1 ABC-type transport system, auxiliary component [Reinekea forsetii]
MRKILAFMGLAGLLMAMPSHLFAQDGVKAADETVREGVQSILTVVRKYAGSEDEAARQAYLDEVTELLEPVIGYSVIARKVMGEAYSVATRAQKIRFLEVFKRSMVNTYAGGIYAFGAFEVNLLPSQDDKKDTLRNTRVYMEVISPDGPKYPLVQSVYYSRKSDDWKMQNAIFNGINLGVTFRTQFEQLYSEAGGDLDATILAWERITEDAYKSIRFRE